MNKFSYFLIMIMFFSIPAHGGDLLKTIKKGCRNDGAIKEYGFGKVTRHNSNDRGPRTEYYISKTYDTYIKNSNNYEEIGFYTKLKKNANGNNPRSIWHIIAIPSEKQIQSNVRGYMNTNTLENAIKFGVINRDEEDFLNDNEVYMTQKGRDYYIHNPINDTEIRTQVHIIWSKLLKERFVKLAHQKIGFVFYDFWFYNYPIDEKPDNFNTVDGYLIPSTKKVKKRGRVYGFVLDDKKKCIGYKELLVK